MDYIFNTLKNNQPEKSQLVRKSMQRTKILRYEKIFLIKG